LSTKEYYRESRFLGVIGMAEPLGRYSPRLVASLVCREAGDLCIEREELGEEELHALVGIELAVMETYSLVASELGLDAIKECLESDECLDQLVDTTREATTLYVERKYFFTVSLDEVKEIADYLRRHLDDHDGAPPRTRQETGKAPT